MAKVRYLVEAHAEALLGAAGPCEDAGRAAGLQRSAQGSTCRCADSRYPLPRPPRQGRFRRKVSLRHDSRLHHIGLGREHKGSRRCLSNDWAASGTVRLGLGSETARCPNELNDSLGPNATRWRKASVVEQHAFNGSLEPDALEDANSNSSATRLGFSGLDFSFYFHWRREPHVSRDHRGLPLTNAGLAIT